MIGYMHTSSSIKPSRKVNYLAEYEAHWEPQIKDLSEQLDMKKSLLSITNTKFFMSNIYVCIKNSYIFIYAYICMYINIFALKFFNNNINVSTNFIPVLLYL